MSSYRFTDNSASPLLSATVSDTTKQVAGPVPVIDFQTYTFQAEWTGTLNGTIIVTGSLDGKNFRQFGASVPTQPTGSASGVLIPLYGHGMKWIQLEFTPSSGSGTYIVCGLGKTR